MKNLHLESKTYFPSLSFLISGVCLEVSTRTWSVALHAQRNSLKSCFTSFSGTCCMYLHLLFIIYNFTEAV